MQSRVVYSVEIDLGSNGVRMLQLRSALPLSRKQLRTRINAAIRPFKLAEAAEVFVCEEQSTWLTL